MSNKDQNPSEIQTTSQEIDPVQDFQDVPPAREDEEIERQKSGRNRSRSRVKILPEMETNESEISESSPTPTGKIFLGEEDKRILRKFNSRLVSKLGLSGTRSFRI